MPAPSGAMSAWPLRPVAGSCEETEVSGARRDNLGGELTGAVEQAHERTAHRLPVASEDTTGDDGFLLDVDACRNGLALNGCSTHDQ
jgi:hypothetical protein